MTTLVSLAAAVRSPRRTGRPAHPGGLPACIVCWSSSLPVAWPASSAPTKPEQNWPCCAQTPRSTSVRVQLAARARGRYPSARRKDQDGARPDRRPGHGQRNAPDRSLRHRPGYRRPDPGRGREHRPLSDPRHHFASYNGTAPIDASSGEQVRHRLSRAGNRRLNHALHMMAVTQIRQPAQPWPRLLRTQAARRQDPKEALRCVKRRLSDVVYRQLVADQRGTIERADQLRPRRRRRLHPPRRRRRATPQRTHHRGRTPARRRRVRRPRLGRRPPRRHRDPRRQQTAPPDLLEQAEDTRTTRSRAHS